MNIQVPIKAEVWTDDTVERLTKLWAEGYSESTVGQMLGLSRGQVSGKLARLNLPTPERKLSRAGAPRSARKAESAPKRKKSLFEMFVPRPEHDMAEKALHIAFLDLQPHHCRYPYGNGPYTFCGHPQVAGSSYCDDHKTFTCQIQAVNAVRISEMSA